MSNELTTQNKIPPTIEEVKEYIMQSGSKVDAVAFYQYHTLKDWKINNTQIEDWQAVLRNWDRLIED
ncbi:hypothetical protein [Elizabethkingia ursingii]|uniref:hypothetical protein n=1 Tax=Elizabethkingia ursingii TaxID=1756150 RepID=UPI0020133A09|nr:hypothetical protein [Elizabethkingia ursingii]MCL1671755.1 hypothetical protein [Elizabethkingia ursingii]